MSTTMDPLDRSQIELLLKRGEGDSLARIVEKYRTLSWEGRNELRRELRQGDYAALAHTAHSLKGASANLGAKGLAQVCAELEMHARQVDLIGSDEFADANDLMERFEAEFTRVQVALMLLAPEG
jgi:HPt (histidine-containing phosphotransfer) domain-containing protein